MRLKFSMPLYSLIPTALGLFMVWIFFEIFGLLGYTHCTDWQFFESAPRGNFRIVNIVKDKIYLRSQDGTLYCTISGQWQKCSPPVFESTQEDAPIWLHSYFTLPAAQAEPIQLTRISSRNYFALLENGEIWSCSTNFQTESNQIVHSRAVILLVIPALIGFACFAIFMKIFIERGSPVLWDFFGRGRRVK
ncbi:MAG: hypothetical protein H6634_07175 [Anaerolineales bacterium]|nr:hypothetical protein [Anaerolineales bacterium]